MTEHPSAPPALLLLVAGAKGAVASTLALAAALLRRRPEMVLPSLTTAGRFPRIGPETAVAFAGWDTDPLPLTHALTRNGVVSMDLWGPVAADLDAMELRPAPDPALDLHAQVDRIIADVARFKSTFPEAHPVLLNLLPAAVLTDIVECDTFADMCARVGRGHFPDLAYVFAAVRSGVPVVNFTPNAVEVPAVVAEAEANGVPLCGRDGKTGQTYFKGVLASAFKARSLYVDGWYSLNLLGNADGRNLMSPDKAAAKLANKTEFLDEILGYPVGERYGSTTHTVRIDYYPPRGDAKEAWDVIDFTGLFGLPMSLRVNLQGRDSILAAPMALDLARWMAALQASGRSGLVPELGFYFKKPVGEAPAVHFQDQLAALDRLAASIG